MATYQEQRYAFLKDGTDITIRDDKSYDVYVQNLIEQDNYEMFDNIFGLWIIEGLTQELKDKIKASQKLRSLQFFREIIEFNQTLDASADAYAKLLIILLQITLENFERARPLFYYDHLVDAFQQKIEDLARSKKTKVKLPIDGEYIEFNKALTDLFAFNGSNIGDFTKMNPVFNFFARSVVRPFKMQTVYVDGGKEIVVEPAEVFYKTKRGDDPNSEQGDSQEEFQDAIGGTDDPEYHELDEDDADVDDETSRNVKIVSRSRMESLVAGTLVDGYTGYVVAQVVLKGSQDIYLCVHTDLVKKINRQFQEIVYPAVTEEEKRKVMGLDLLPSTDADFGPLCETDEMNTSLCEPSSPGRPPIKFKKTRPPETPTPSATSSETASETPTPSATSAESASETAPEEEDLT
jgi:hypothetical protein